MTATAPQAPASSDLLADVLSVMTEGHGRAWSQTLCERLAALSPDLYRGWDPTTLAMALREYGVKTKNMRIPGEKRVLSGVMRSHVVRAHRGATRPASPTAVLYRCYDGDGQLLYTGISITFLNRLGQHRQGSEWFSEVRSITVDHFDSRKAAAEAERIAILEDRPLHNTIYNG